MTNLIDLRDTKAHMLSALNKAQEKRQERLAMVDTFDAWGYKTKVPEWHLYELGTMLLEVNRFRTANKLSPIDIVQLQRVESMACGHSDYSSKFALYCAELAIKNVKEIKP